MTKFASKQIKGWNHYHLTYDWNMSALTTPKCFIASGKMHKVLTIILHTPQVTKATSLLEAKPKQFFYIGCD
jgi:hypothetical protein